MHLNTLQQTTTKERTSSTQVKVTPKSNPLGLFKKRQAGELVSWGVPLQATCRAPNRGGMDEMFRMGSLEAGGLDGPLDGPCLLLASATFFLHRPHHQSGFLGVKIGDSSTR